MKISYVSLSRFATISEELLTHFASVTVLRVWIPSTRVQKILKRVNSPHARKLLARSHFLGSKEVKYRNSLLLEMVVRFRSRSSTLFWRIFFYSVSFFLRIRLVWLSFRNDLLIVPGDIWDLIPPRMRVRVLLEIRWLTQDFIDTLQIPKLEYHQDNAFESSGIPVMPRKVFLEFSGYITYSNIAKQSIQLSGADSNRILVTPLLDGSALNSVNQVKFPRSNRFLYVGRSAPDKRLDLAVEIAQKLGIPIDIVGKYNPATIKWLHKQTGVNFLGTLPHNEVLTLMESNFALLAPGAESWGLAVVEALQSGMQVYASKYTGVTEWISHPNLHKLPEMNSEIFIREFGLIQSTTEVFRIFDDYDLAVEWENFLLNRIM